VRSTRLAGDPAGPVTDIPAESFAPRTLPPAGRQPCGYADPVAAKENAREMELSRCEKDPNQAPSLAD